MKTITKILSVATVVAGLVVQLAPAIQAWIAAHPTVTLSSVVLAVVGALVHNPKSVQ